ncbi:DUF4007 family protein [Ferruginibacter yonginensis]|uniref:DUF4007 family protein n=1 Tax=Ferruginibacter yonginensis TaxID=1310416 RepID=A0ABV8QTM1_9BACT
MSEKNKIPSKLTFSGHDTFHCRHLWLKKGYEFVKDGNKFSDEDAVVKLGVGKNMVSGINYWLRAFGIIDKDGALTEFAQFILDDTGKDPYLEDEATLWLLHYQLVTQNIASTYNLIFNELRRERIEFTKDSFVAFVLRKAEELGLTQINKNTVATDFEVLIKMYIRTDAQSKDKEDTFSGLLTELNIIQEEKRKINDKTEVFFSVAADDKVEIPDEIILYSILDQENTGNSISLYSIEQEKNQAGSVFAIGRTGLVNKIESLTKSKIYKKYSITFNDHAGIKELQFKTKPNKFEVLNNYYGN